MLHVPSVSLSRLFGTAGKHLHRRKLWDYLKEEKLQLVYIFAPYFLTFEDGMN